MCAIQFGMKTKVCKVLGAFMVFIKLQEKGMNELKPSFC